jgi:hypothetical protein
MPSLKSLRQLSIGQTGLEITLKDCRLSLSKDDTNCPVPRQLQSNAVLCTFLKSGHPRRAYPAKNLAASSATVSERNTQMSPLEVRSNASAAAREHFTQSP